MSAQQAVRGLEVQLAAKFGREATNSICVLTCRIRAYDALLVGREESIFENFLSLPPEGCRRLLERLEILADSSIFAAAFVIEQIPVLSAHGFLDELVDLGLSAVSASGREVAYMFGSSSLQTPDIGKVLAATRPSFFKALLCTVREAMPEAALVAPRLIRAAASLQGLVCEDELGAFVSFALDFSKKHGSSLAALLLSQVSAILEAHSLPELQCLVGEEAPESSYLEVFLHNPKTLPIRPRFGDPLALSEQELRALKLRVLESGDLSPIALARQLLGDRYFQALASRWATFPVSFKANVLSQLGEAHFRSKLISAQGGALSSLNERLRARWDQRWCFTDRAWNEAYVFQRLRRLLLAGGHFSLSSRKFYSKSRQLVEKLKSSPDWESLHACIAALQALARTDEARAELGMLDDFVCGRHRDFLRRHRSQKLLLSVWERDPWVDYARSDEIFACKSLGDYAEVHVPAYLADLSISNLDVWCNGNRVGRIHLALTRTETGAHVLLVDSVEGTERMLQTESRRSQLLDGILSYGRYLGVEEVVLNTEIYFNHTPKAFIDHVARRLRCRKEQRLLSRVVPGFQTARLLPFPIDSVLESLKGKNSGIVSGYSFRPNSIVI